MGGIKEGQEISCFSHHVRNVGIHRVRYIMQKKKPKTKKQTKRTHSLFNFTMCPCCQVCPLTQLSQVGIVGQPAPNQPCLLLSLISYHK